MEYTKTVWKDLPDTSTPITADRLNNIENGVEYLFENGTGGGDNLPVGVEMDFDGTSQDIPTGWEQVEEIVLKKEITADVLGDAGVNWQNLGDLYLDLTVGTWFVKANTFIVSNGNGVGYNKSCLSFNSTGGAVYDRLDSMTSSYPNEQGETHASVHSLSCVVSVKETTRIYLLEAFAYTIMNGSMTLKCDKDIASGGPSLIEARKLY